MAVARRPRRLRSSDSFRLVCGSGGSGVRVSSQFLERLHGFGALGQEAESDLEAGVLVPADESVEGSAIAAGGSGD